MRLFLTYAVVFFTLGYLIFASPGFVEIVRRLRWIMLGVGIIALSSGLLFFLDELADPVSYYGSAGFVFVAFIQALSTWGWLFAILGLGSRYLERNNRLLSYANEAVLPFYILHQTVIISIGFYVVQWSAGVGLKYLTISTTSFVAIMLIYELLMRRVNVLRFLFGMRLRRKQLEPGKTKIIEPAAD